MKILVNRKIKRLFLYVLLAVAIFTVASILMICLGLKNIALYVAIAAVLMVLIICAVLYWYFRDQSKTMNEAIEQIGNTYPGTRMPVLSVTMRATCTGCSTKSILWSRF